MKSKQKQYVHVKKAAKYLGYSESHVYKLAREGMLTRYFVGTTTSYRLDMEEVRAFPKKGT